MLRRAGFATSERPFKYSAFPGLWATPVAGVVAVLAAIGFYVGRTFPDVLAVTVASLVVVLVGLSLVGRGVLTVSSTQRWATNLEATRFGSPPSVWLVAHLDSKWQPVSMIMRVIGVIGTTIGLVACFALAVLADRTSDAAALIVLLVTCAAAVPLMLSIVGDRNHGTLDNASGVAAVLEAIELMPRDARVGVLISDAEELGLAGARAWARSRPSGVALNCDSVDDDGPLTVMFSRSRPSALIARVEAAAKAEGEPFRSFRLIPGILTDSVALASYGWQTVTLSRGRLRTLQRIHTSRDTLSAMSGAGIASVARVLARTAQELV